MGDFFSVLATPVTVVGATVTGQANKKYYYLCPRCHRRVWVYAAFSSFWGSKCAECRTHSGPLDFGLSKEAAEFQGDVVYAQWGEQEDYDNSHSVKLSDKIKWYETRSCRILHGSYSWAANAVAQTATLGKVPLTDHWWLVIRTQNGDFYQLQFRGLLSSYLNRSNRDGLVELRKCSSSYECNQTGLAEANKECDADVLKPDYDRTFNNPLYTIGDVVNWMKSGEFSASYDLYNHNCQDLCKAFYRDFPFPKKEEEEEEKKNKK